MGNTSSVPSSLETQGHPRKPSQKLSKPRTGNPASAGLLPNGFSTSTSRFSSARMSNQALPLSPVVSSYPVVAASAALVPDDNGNTKESIKDKMAAATSTTVQHKESKRRSLFRSLSSQKTTTTQVSGRNPSVGPSPEAPAPPVADKVIRANSMTYESTQAHIAYYAQPPIPVPENPRSSMSSRRTSWNYDMSSYEAKRLLNLVEEPTLEQTAILSERMTTLSESTWKSSSIANITQLPDSTPISRVNSDVSLYTPVRRRSIIQTPGVATRLPYTSPAPSRHRAPSFRHSHPPTPTLSRQPSLDSIRSGILSMPMPPRILDSAQMHRVVTPSEEKYQSIGAFRLGSLRITNGAASPMTPEMEATTSKTGLPHMGVIQERGDYFVGTAVVADVVQSETAQSSSHKAQELVPPQPRAPDLSPIAASFREADVREQNTNVVVKATPEEYLAEISFSHFDLDQSAPLNPELLTTSKHTAMEDELFEDEGGVEYSSVEVLDVRLDPNAKSQTGAQQKTQLSMTSVTRTDSGFVSGSPSDELPPKPLTKADSGYSSNISLRSFQNSKSQAAENEDAGSLKEPSSSINPAQTAEQAPHSPTKISHVRQPSREPPPPPPVPPKDSMPVGQSAPVSIHTKNLTLESTETLLASPTSSRFRAPASPHASMRSGEPVLRSPGTPTSTRSDASGSALSIGSGSNRPSKLQRLISGATRRQSHGPLTAHATHAFDKAAIPSIPQEVETKLHQHTGMFPITSKRLALKPKASKDTLKTIFSVGSMEINFDSANDSRTLSDDGMPEHDGSRGRQLVHSVQSSIIDAAAHILPRKSLARKPVPARKDSVERGVVSAADPEVVLPSEAEMTSYNWVNTSLGHNPYDAALVAMADRSLSQSLPQSVASRTFSMTAPVEHSVYTNLTRRPSTSYQSARGASLPGPGLPRRESRETIMPKKTKTPPPVSMMTRSRSSLRQPAPLRHQTSNSSLSHKNSRENIHSYPSSQQHGANNQSLSRRSSREDIHSYPSYRQGHNTLREESMSPPPIPPINPRRSLSRDRTSQHAAAFEFRRQNSSSQINLAVSRRRPCPLWTIAGATRSWTTAEATRSPPLNMSSKGTRFSDLRARNHTTGLQVTLSSNCVIVPATTAPGVPRAARIHRRCQTGTRLQ